MSFDMEFTGAWVDLERILKTPRDKLDKAAMTAARDVADHCLLRIKDGMQSAAPAGINLRPLKESTIRRRRYGRTTPRRTAAPLGETPLIAHGDLMEALTVTTYGTTFFLGIPEGKMGREGQRLWVIAKVHEYGAIGVASSKNGVVTFLIPPRPFVMPIIEQTLDASQEQIMRICMRRLLDVMGRA